MRSTLGSLGFRLLTLVLLAACSSEPVVSEPDAGDLFDAGGVDALRDAGGGLDAGCVARGCDELGYECGQTVDNCGDPLNCNLENNLSPCEAPARCGGDPDLGANRCGCKPRANPCEAQGAQCGTVDECGREVQCGDCPSGALCLNNLCACTPNPNPCGDRICGSAPDGCGKMVQCGPSQGQCASGTCDASGRCVCPPAATACQGKSGKVTLEGCEYTCQAGSCAPDNASACAGAECGSARNNCGEIVRCGPADGACSAGQTCVGTHLVADTALPARSARYQGGYCAPSNVAKLVGKYAVRAHAYREAGSNALSVLNRAEAVSLSTIQYVRATGQPRLLERGCIAGTTGDPEDELGVGAKASFPKYRNLPVASVDLTVEGTTWFRPDAPHPLLGTGLPLGWRPGMPAFCVGREGQLVELPADDPRRGKWLPDNRCQCPTAEGQNALPGRAGAGEPNNYSTTPLNDCRIVDDDADGKPGFTSRVTALILSSEVYGANVAHGTASGVIRDDRYHTGHSREVVSPPMRVVVGCASTGGACAAPGLDCSCGDTLQRVQFVPLADDAVLDCNAYLTAPNTASEAINQVAIDTQFSVPFGTCSGPGQCPDGAICRANRCFPATSKGACTAGTKNPCPAGTYCEPCPDDPSTPYLETSCRADTACWPTEAACPPRAPIIGGRCMP